MTDDIAMLRQENALLKEELRKMVQLSKTVENIEDENCRLFNQVQEYETQLRRCGNELDAIKMPHEWQPGDEGWFWLFCDGEFKHAKWVRKDGVYEHRNSLCNIQNEPVDGWKFFRAVLPEVVTNAIS